MKQKVFTALVVAVAVTLSGYNVYQSQKAKAEMSDTMLENVEALASGESGVDVYCCGDYGTCMLILGGGEVKGIKFYTPCPK